MKFNSFLLGTVLMLSLLAVPFTASAQVDVPDPNAVSLAFDHDKVQTDGYRLHIDAAAGVQITNLTSLPNGYRFPFPAVTPGLHELRVSAFNAAGTSGLSNALNVRVLVIPSDPSNLRLVLNRLMFRQPQFDVIVTAADFGNGWEPVLLKHHGKLGKKLTS